MEPNTHEKTQREKDIGWLIRERLKEQARLERTADLLENSRRREVKSMRAIRDPKTGETTWTATYYKEKGYTAIRDPETGRVIRIERDKSKDLD
jgi:hypothetical protein